MAETLLDRLRRRRRPRPTIFDSLYPQILRRYLMSLGILDGFRTYIIAIAMILAALAQLIGLDIPSFDGQSAGHLLMEGLAILFLRKGMKLGNG